MMFDFTMEEFLSALEKYQLTDTPFNAVIFEFTETVVAEVIKKVSSRASTPDIMKALFANGIYVGMIVAHQKMKDPFNNINPEHNKYLH